MNSKPAILEPLEQRQLLAATAQLVRDIVLGTGAGMSPGNTSFAPLGKSIIFAASDGRPWISDGTDDLNEKHTTGLDFGLVESSDFVNVKGTVYFSARRFSETNPEIYAVSGINEQGATQVSHFAGNATPVFLRNINDTLVFMTVNVKTGSPGLYRLPQAGEQATEPQLILNIDGALFLGQANGEQYFSGKSPDLSHIGLWATNGSTAGFVKDFSIGTNNGLSLSSSAGFKSRLYFPASNLVSGNEPWRSDGTESGTQQLSEIAAGSDSSSPGQFTVSGDALYFVATRKGAAQLFSTTGTGAKQVTNFAPGSISSLADAGGTLYFAYTPNTSTIGTLYKLSEGVVTAIKPGAGGGSSPSLVTAVGSTVYFSGLDKSNVRRLFSCDGTAISPVGGDAGTDPTLLSVVSGSLFFSATDPTHGRELHVVKAAPTQSTPIGLKIKSFQQEVDEGGFASFKATFNSGVTIEKYLWDLEGSGIFQSGPQIVKVFCADETNPNFPRTVSVIARDADGNSEKATVSFSVNNVAPTITDIDMPRQWTTYVPMQYTIKVKEPGPKDDDIVLIDWGDGTTSGVDVINGEASGSHRFLHEDTASGNVRLKVYDNADAISYGHASVSIVPLAAVTIGKTVTLLLGGTSGNDVLSIVKSQQQPTNGKISLDFFRNGDLVGTRSLDPHAIIDAGMGPGNDKFFVPSDLQDLFVFKVHGDEGKFDEFNGKVIK